MCIPVLWFWCSDSYVVHWAGMLRSAGTVVVGPVYSDWSTEPAPPPSELAAMFTESVVRDATTVSTPAAVPPEITW